MKLRWVRRHVPGPGMVLVLSSVGCRLFNLCSVAMLLVVFLACGNTEPSKSDVQAEAKSRDTERIPEVRELPPGEMPGDDNTLLVGVMRPFSLSRLTEGQVCSMFVGEIPGAAYAEPTFEERWVLNLTFDTVVPLDGNQLQFDSEEAKAEEASESVRLAGEGQFFEPSWNVLLPDGMSSALAVTAEVVGALSQDLGQCIGRVSFQTENPLAQGWSKARVSGTEACFAGFLQRAEVPNSVLVQYSGEFGFQMKPDGSSDIKYCRQNVRTLFASVPILGSGNERLLRLPTSGPFRFFCDGARGAPECTSQDLWLVANQWHPVVGKLSDKYRFIHFHSYGTAMAPFEGEGAPHIVLTPSPIPLRQTIGENWRRGHVPMSTQLWAVYNPSRLSDRGLRAWLAGEVLGPAALDAITGLLGPGVRGSAGVWRNDTWLPLPWDPSGANVGGSNCSAPRFDAKVAEGVAPACPGVLKVGLWRTNKDANDLIMKLVESIASRVASCGAEVQVISTEDSNSMLECDIILVSTGFNSDPSDPSQALDGLIGQLRRWKGFAVPVQTTISSLVARLRDYRLRLLTGARASGAVAAAACSIQGLLADSMIIQPLWTGPMFVYYDGSRLHRPPMANFLRGFVSLPAWLGEE